MNLVRIEFILQGIPVRSQSDTLTPDSASVLAFLMPLVLRITLLIVIAESFNQL